MKYIFQKCKYLPKVIIKANDDIGGAAAFIYFDTAFCSHGTLKLMTKGRLSGTIFNDYESFDQVVSDIEEAGLLHSKDVPEDFAVEPSEDMCTDFGCGGDA